LREEDFRRQNEQSRAERTEGYGGVKAPKSKHLVRRRVISLETRFNETFDASELAEEGSISL
jgi:hypothetical protein